MTGVPGAVGPAPRWAWVLVVLGVVLGAAALVLALRGPWGPTDAGPGVIGTVAPATTPAGWDVTGVDLVAYADGLLAATNAARTAEGVEPLTVSGCARDGAAARAADLVGDATLEHAPLDPVLTSCAPASAAAENLSRAAAEPPAVVDAWLASTGHRANVLDPTLEELGVACVRDEDQVLCSAVFLGP